MPLPRCKLGPRARLGKKMLFLDGQLPASALQPHCSAKCRDSRAHAGGRAHDSRWSGTESEKDEHFKRKERELCSEPIFKAGPS